jgi:hypothetical protein
VFGAYGSVIRTYDLLLWSQSYDRELQRQRFKNFHTTSSQVRFEIKKIFSSKLKNALATSTLAL